MWREAGHENAVAKNDRIGRSTTADVAHGKPRWPLTDSPQDDARENARKIGEWRASLDETAEIFKLAR
ncbi:MAG: hypothetical protein HY290_15535 [Planctomycetia bacterium]|nr:hypothetical protein [Planctomycetia bacterium]